MLKSIAAIAAVALLSVVGCSSSPGTTSGTTGTGGGGTASAGNEPYFGTFNLAATTVGATTAYTAVAGFYANSGGSDSSSCPAPGTQSGSCCYIPTGTKVTPPTQVSAGTLTLTDKGAQIGQLSVSGTTYAPLSSLTSSSLVWSPGDTITVSAAGATVQAFTGTGVAPPDIAGLSPMPSETAPLTVTDASGLTLTWTPGSGDSQVFLSLEDASINVITCQTAITAGTLSVPSALLMHLSGTGNIGVHSQSETSFDGPNANVGILMIGDLVNGQAKFQ